MIIFKGPNLIKILILFLFILSILVLMLIFFVRGIIEENERFRMIISLLVLPVINGILISFLFKFFIPDEYNYKIKECKDGIRNVDNIKWDYTKELNILTLTLTPQYFPNEIQKNISKFKEVNIILDHSRKMTGFRNSVLNRNVKEDGGTQETITALLRYKGGEEYKNINIFVAELVQIPLGVIIHNADTIIYSPFWNHKNTHDSSGAMGGTYLRINSKTEFGKDIINSFYALKKNENRINNFDFNEIAKYYESENT